VATTTLIRSAVDSSGRMNFVKTNEMGAPVKYMGFGSIKQWRKKVRADCINNNADK
jgi:hypothetical protein